LTNLFFFVENYVHMCLMNVITLSSANPRRVFLYDEHLKIFTCHSSYAQYAAQILTHLDTLHLVSRINTIVFSLLANQLSSIGLIPRYPSVIRGGFEFSLFFWFKSHLTSMAFEISRQLTISCLFDIITFR